jgi:D-alanine-D-alanine ligase
MPSAKHVAVLMGGWSAEREVSLRSGKACAEALEKKGYRVTKIDVGRDIATVLQTLKPDAVLNVLHGRPGEDGTLQGILEIVGVPYSHSGVLASAMAMKKNLAKTLFRAAGVPTPGGMVVSRHAAAREHALERPYVLKPIAEGSSVGVFIVTKAHDYPPQELTRADWEFGDALLAEPFIPGKELTCAVMGDEALGVIDILPTARFYDYEAKYAPGGSTHILPAEISPFVYQEVRRLAVAAHRALGCRGVSRADFRFDDTAEGIGGLVCLEVNTQPGMTETSLVPELAAHAGIPFAELVQWMVEDASLNR